MLIRTSACALILAASLAPQALAQQPSHPFFNAASAGSPEAPAVEIGRGPVIWQNYNQQKRVEAMMPRIEKAVAAQLAQPQAAELRGLRTGRYQQAMVVCGFIEIPGVKGDTEKQRFIARPTVATLETTANRDAFQAGWTKVGCGF